MAPSIETQNQLQTRDRDTIFETHVQLQTPGKNLLTKEKKKAEIHDEQLGTMLLSSMTGNILKKWARSHHKFLTHKHKKGPKKDDHAWQPEASIDRNE